MKIYTKTGDDGSTGLLYGGRIDKDDLRTQAYGTTDEAVAVLGLARALGPAAKSLGPLLLTVQRDLFVLGAELATAAENASKLTAGVSKVTEDMIARLETEIDRMTDEAPLPDHFIVPGETAVGATIDVARSVVRRAERLVVTLVKSSALSDDLCLRYLNRLSDFLFTAARFEETAAGTVAPASRET
ncbi:MAG TPA: cob(I)yrinic acid a,c-diamide adenosyltransferase [Actinomycetota bacterium]|nr:cob(I)yrinic acid a,c-diamide adenosyltransferase [Actinomycetota bacterium]